MMGRNFVNSFLHGILYARFIVNLSSLSLTGRVAKCYRKGGVFWKLCIFATVRGAGNELPKMDASAFWEYPHSHFAWLAFQFLASFVTELERFANAFSTSRPVTVDATVRRALTSRIIKVAHNGNRFGGSKCLVRRKSRKIPKKGG